MSSDSSKNPEEPIHWALTRRATCPVVRRGRADGTRGGADVGGGRGGATAASRRGTRLARVGKRPHDAAGVHA